MKSKVSLVILVDDIILFDTIKYAYNVRFAAKLEPRCTGRKLHGRFRSRGETHPRAALATKRDTRALIAINEIRQMPGSFFGSRFSTPIPGAAERVFTPQQHNTKQTGSRLF